MLGSSTDRIDTLQKIELAEGVEIAVRPAGPLPRGLAYALDWLILIACIIVLGFVFTFAIAFFGMGMGEDGSNFALGIYLICLFLLLWGYFIFFEAGKRGATPGKRALGLRVVRPSGAPATLGQITIRNLIRFFDFLPFANAIGVIAIAFTPRFQRLGDLAANTLVVYDRETPLPPPPVLNLDPLAPTMVLSREEQLAVGSYLDRVTYWSDDRKIELGNLASALTGKSGVEGVNRLLAMGLWLRRDREEKPKIATPFHSHPPRPGSP